MLKVPAILQVLKTETKHTPWTRYSVPINMYQVYYIVRALTCKYFKALLSRGFRAVFFAIFRSLDLFPRLFLRLAVALGSEGRARVTFSLTSPRRWLQRARKIVSSQSILVFLTRRLRTPTQSEACLFFCNSTTGCGCRGCPCMAIDVFCR